MMANPIFLFAFAYDPANALPGVITELKALQKIISDAGVEPVVIWQATQSDIEEQFLKHREGIRLFHYSGHSGRNILELNGAGTERKIVFSEGLAGFASITRCLRLVFLNGCSTEDQSQYFLQHGAPAVIATTVPLLDHLGLQFAVDFYKFYTVRRNSKSLDLKQAFEITKHSFTGRHGPLELNMLHESIRSVYFKDDEHNNAVYRLILNPDHPAAESETFSDWLEICRGEDVQTRDQTIAEIRRLIGKAQIKLALDHLVNIAPNEGLQLQSNFELVNDQYFMNLISAREWLQEQSRISFNILQILQKIT